LGGTTGVARNDHIARTLAVLSALTVNRHGIALRTLAERHSWNLRTLYRDIEALERAGWSVINDAGRFRIELRGTPAPVAALDFEEVRALYIARELSRGIRDTSVGRALDRVWAKASSATTRVPALFADPPPWFSHSSPVGIDYGAHKKMIATLERALRDRLAIRCVYEATTTGEVTRRVIEPAELHWDTHLESLYVIGWCRLRRDIRVFAVHRFRAVHLTDEPLQPRSQVSSRAALRSAFRVWRGANVNTVRVRFDRATATRVAERKWHPSQKVERLRDGALVLTMEVGGLQEVTSWILGFGPSARVLGPDALVERMSAQLSQAASQYESVTWRDNAVAHHQRKSALKER
jgi:predicted DNA-binding transcriptional regulator YafY